MAENDKDTVQESQEDRRSRLQLRERLKKVAADQKEKNGLYTVMIKDAEINDETLQAFRNDFEPFGLTIKLAEKESGRCDLQLIYNPSQLKATLQKSGGRRQKYFETGFTVGEIFDLMAAGVPREELYQATRMSRATFHRRVAFYREHGNLNQSFH
jgi:hypothetical protein